MRHSRSVRRLPVWAIVAIAVIAGRSAAQDSTAAAGRTTATPSYRARVLGVFDASTGAPIEGVEVTGIMSGSTATTTRTGTVALVFLPDGGGIVRVRKLGYEMQTLAIAISPADTVPVTIALQPVARLQGVVTYGSARPMSPRLSGFEERRLHGGTGYFLTEEQLRKEDGRPLTLVLRSHFPGMNLVPGRHGLFLMPSPRCTGGGPPEVYVDGVPWAQPAIPTRPDTSLFGNTSTAKTFVGGQGAGSSAARSRRAKRDSSIYAQPVDLSDFDVWDLAGVEYYPDGEVMPMQFNHTPGACGALLLWTRY